MEFKQQDIPDISVRRKTQRERHLPAYLDDYEVEYQPKSTISTDKPTAGTEAGMAIDQRSAKPRSTSSRSHASGSQCSKPRSQASGHSPSGGSIIAGLTDLQTAMLEEKMKGMELAELQRQMMEESLAEEQCLILDAQAREALSKKEELYMQQERQRRQLDEEARTAHDTRESITRRLSMQRRLKEKEMELKKASLIAAFLRDQEDGLPSSRSLNNCEYESGLQACSSGVNSQVDLSEQPAHNTQGRNSYVNALPPSILPVDASVPDTQPLPPTSSSADPEPVSEPLHGCPTQHIHPAMATPSAGHQYGLQLGVNHPPTTYSTPALRPAAEDSSNIPSRQSQPPGKVKHQGWPPPVPHSTPSQFLLLPNLQSRLRDNVGPTGWRPTAPSSQSETPLPPIDSKGNNLMELLIASSYGIPKPALPSFASGKESDFALLKMALDSLLGSHTHLTEQFKYQILLEQLKLPSAYKLAQAYMHDPLPYTTALQALQDKYGQPRQLVQSELGSILNSPQIRVGDPEAFDNFALDVQALVGMLRSLEGENGYELRCGSHVDKLLSKLPASYRDGFVEYSLSRGILRTGTDKTYTLPDFSAWLQVKSQAKRISSRAADMFQDQTKQGQKGRKSQRYPSTVYYNTDNRKGDGAHLEPGHRTSPIKGKIKPKPYCPYCDTREHYLNLCPKFKTLSTTQIAEWIKDKGCWRCGRNHAPDVCTLKAPCKVCKQQHLTVLHEVCQQEPRKVLMVGTAPDTSTIYIDHPNRPHKVLLKVVKVCLYNAEYSLETFAVLDDGSERSIILPPAVQHLNLQKEAETLPLRTVRQDVIHLQGASVSFEISPAHDPKVRYHIHHAFTADKLGLSEHSYPVKALMQKYAHLQGLPLSPVDRVQPLVLIGSDFPHLLVPTKPVRSGPPGGPLAVCTRLGWVLQGPANLAQFAVEEQQCLFTGSPSNDLLQHVERLWKADVLPYTNVKTATRSKEDQKALEALEQRTIRVQVEGVTRYATPLLRRNDSPRLWAPRLALLPQLRSTERRIVRDPGQAETYCQEVHKLEVVGYVEKLSPEKVDCSSESWYLPHHVVHHNNKARLVFNCSYQYNGLSLNSQLLPGPILGPSLLGVLLRFREHTVAISGDIKAMFHQIRLLPEDRPLLRFLWRSMRKDEEPSVYEWQVLPFGTTCSPCCATYALQRHVRDNRQGNEDILDTVERAFYVDNCLHSLQLAEEAKTLIDRMRELLAKGGFEIRQWASNVPSVVEHLPMEARAASTELWLSQHNQDPEEPALGLRWNCLTDRLGYRHRLVEYSLPTLRNVYRVMASQYDPLGFLIPFSTRAKVLIQDLWKAGVGWDEQIHPTALLDRWTQWEKELVDLPQVELPRCYVPPRADTGRPGREAHIFCDASERAYGAVAYLRTQDSQGDVHVAFTMARSRVSPRKQISMPRLELCAALAGAQLAKVLETELAFQPSDITLWSDSTTVLTWLKSDSCRYKVFVGTRIAEIQDLTEVSRWRYVNTEDNPADDLTRGKTLLELSQPNRWTQGPPFLLTNPDTWPTLQGGEGQEDNGELRATAFCGTTTTCSPQLTVPMSNFGKWSEAVKATDRILHGAAADEGNHVMTATDASAAELHLLKQAQNDSFPEELQALAAGKAIHKQSRLLTLAPEYDPAIGLIRVGGRLRRAEGLDLDAMHPIVLDPQHPVAKLLIRDYDEQLLHPGPERVFGEMRRKYWILRGREAIKRHQHSCGECRRWRASPDVPRMADLPPARLRLYKPPFWSTGVDCFGPYNVKVGRRTEKRWGIIFKCMTTSCVHLDLLDSIDTDAFLMALRRFIARRGKPYEILSDCGTNFRGGESELRASFSALEAPIKEQLAEQKIEFRFNPPGSPHFGGTWEREIRSVKTALQVVLGGNTVTEAVLQTVLIEVEGIINAKPLGYVSSDVADPDPVTPNLLLMGRRDASLPQVIYASSEMLGRRRWRHSQILADHFWSNFLRHHLPDLQRRQRWQGETGNLATGQVVMVVDSQLPRAQWPIGKVVKVCPGPDGRVRAAEVTIKGQTYLRPVARLVRLSAWDDDEDCKLNDA
ncbi:uncharacterized protein LOC109203254 [Oreochromis niloticus]|uniref:uncharacterized protein LOC109203254 n=1 Tax=Oreochromis niloticus TaxID=8128 RepID=UPI000904C84E|nr:uncharacterized protein LOC109203254 [Oreochromis niloticus]